MSAAQAARDDVIDRQVGYMLPAVLAGVIVAAENLTLGEPYTWPRPLNHPLQADNRWPWEDAGNRFYLAAAIEHQGGFSVQDQANGAACGAHINGLKVSIEN
jgi:hypothetical protein